MLMKLCHTLDTDHIGACSLDVGSHAVQEVGHIYHVRLFGCILNDRVACCHGRGHHDIDGSANRYDVQIDMAASQILRLLQ